MLLINQNIQMWLVLYQNSCKIWNTEVSELSNTTRSISHENNFYSNLWSYSHDLYWLTTVRLANLSANCVPTIYVTGISANHQKQLSWYYYFFIIYLFIPLLLHMEHRALTVPHHPRLLFQFLGSIRHLVGLLGGRISPAQSLYLHRTT
jgi:hypothetical protein